MANQSIIAEFWECWEVRGGGGGGGGGVMLGLISALIVFVETSAIAPFIYTLF